jgi:uncharacterized repeat protein (TIGR03803 family)
VILVSNLRCFAASTLLLFFPILATSAGAEPSRATMKAIHNFVAGSTGTPQSGVVLGHYGVVYGNTFDAIYSLTPQAGSGWIYAVLYAFVPAVSGPGENGLAIDEHGVLYGTTRAGGGGTGCGGYGCGTVFSLTPPATRGGAWTENTIYSFTGGTDGATPSGGVLVGSGPVLYGTTSAGGSMGFGAVFSLTAAGTSWTEETLFSFPGGSNGGANPAGYLAIDGSGTLYGTTQSSQPSNGTAYSLKPPSAPGGAWTETVIYVFSAPGEEEQPSGGVLVGRVSCGTVLYGTVANGGTANAGAIYSLTPAVEQGPWTETLLYSFPEQRYPLERPVGPGPLSWGRGGILYGATYNAGQYEEGSVFALKPPTAPGEAWAYEHLWSFGGNSSGGINPGYFANSETLAVGANGLIYGTTSSYAFSTSYFATVFVVRP